MEAIQIISHGDPRYPQRLKMIPDAPAKLYVRGNPEALHGTGFGIVGTRRPSAYGQQAAIHMALELSAAGLTIVSGMAPGIDTFAHQTCVESNHPTVAVLGTGVDERSLYPKSNLRLSRQIIDGGGCLVSELPPGEHGSKITFPKRNRIVSGLSIGVLVVEAKEKSGSLITAGFAKRQHKPLFAVPGQIFSQNAAGPNRLIQQGATLAQAAGDILKALNLAQAKPTESILPDNEEECSILAVLQNEAKHIDDIIKQTRLTPAGATSALAMMEISGKIRNLGGNIYAKN